MTAPTGYVLNDMEYHVELFPGRESELVVTDEKKPDLKIIKTDAVTGKPIAGATFTIRKMDSSTLMTETTDAKGEIFLSEMDPGVYEVTEQSVPDAFLLDPRPQKITLFPNKLGVVQFQDYQKPTLTIKKIDSATGKPVEGARFHVIYASNHTFTGEVNDLGEYYSDANGLIKLDKLIDGWYQVTEVQAPEGYRIPDSGVQECYITAGTDKPAQLRVTITKTGVKEVLAGSRMTYHFTVANGSNVALENFFWHDKLPYDISSASGLTTGTYNTRLTYRILYKTNCNDYRVLASNLLSTNNYGFQLNALKLMDGEVVTDIYFDFGTVPAGFQSTTQPTLTVAVSPTATNGYYVTNRADAGGKYGGTWETNNTSWLTIVKNLTPVKNDPLPKTGY